MVKAVGIDTVHFGIVVTVNLAIGLFHPPFGINIFVAQSVLGLKLETIYRGIIPFVIIYLIALALITYVPEISLIGVRTLLRKAVEQGLGGSAQCERPSSVSIMANVAASMLTARARGRATIHDETVATDRQRRDA